MDKAAQFLQFFFLDKPQRVEVLDLGGDPAGKIGGVEVGDFAHAALARHQALPHLDGVIADRANKAKTRDNDPSGQNYFPPFACLSMYSDASRTVRIFSASSSGISRSNASSKAMTNSTISSESAPRSSTNDALVVTSPSSTPSCSTMICLIFSSTAVAAIWIPLFSSS